MRQVQIEAYCAVLKHGTMQAAAKALGVSQPAISRRVSQLERALGLSLFIRDKTRLIPTRESRVLAPHLRAHADWDARIKRLAREVRAGNSAAINLRIAVPASLTLSIMPAIVAEFLGTYDKTHIEIHTGPYDAIERMLLDDRAELGFIRLPVQQQGLHVRPVVQVRTVCVLPLAHPLTAKETISIADLRDTELILLGRQRAPRSEIDKSFYQHGITPKVRVEAHSVCSACGMVASGLGVTLVNDLMARDYAHMPVAVRPIEEPLYHQFAFASSAELPAMQTSENFIQLSTKRLTELMQEPA
ncbi:MAG: LysR family transcriptional regulator [Pseudomonadota bacterium]